MRRASCSPRHHGRSRASPDAGANATSSATSWSAWCQIVFDSRCLAGLEPGYGASVKHRDLLKRLAEIAADTELKLVRQTGGHDIFRVGSTNLSVPRHNEVNEYTAKGIIKDAQEEGP